MGNLIYEQELLDKGYKLIAGIDEAGRGALAGPLVVASVILPSNYQNSLINDSKALNDKTRRMLYKEIVNNALDYAIIVIDVEEITKYNIYQATKRGMLKALNSLKEYDASLSDAMNLENGKPNISLIKGDRLSQTIAAASILAKVYRDDLMLDYDRDYPEYSFKDHKGYGTKKHLSAIEEKGILPIHRPTFEPLKTLLRPKLF